MLPAFKKGYQKKDPVLKTMTGKKRERKAGAGRKGSLNRKEQKLLFTVIDGEHFVSKAY